MGSKSMLGKNLRFFSLGQPLAMHLLVFTFCFCFCEEHVLRRLWLAMLAGSQVMACVDAASTSIFMLDVFVVKTPASPTMSCPLL